MNISKETQNMITAALLLTLAVMIQILGKSIPQINQLFVGPIVNAVLLLAVYFSSVRWAMLIGVLTPLLAFFTGVLASPMAPFIPFIALGNFLYVLIFSFFRKQRFGESIGVLTASLVKFLFLYFSATILIDLIAIGIPQPVKEKLAVSMGLPQFITAVLGGAIAIALYKMLKRRISSI
ncbi:ECF transporter S component [Proteiniclasticum sp.]|uniref:ECF transporter S component n=1 Tax=Proteiniclasticum sp. TaxID=2053595 RepID=UPI0028A0D51D|nr:ECF transporter S component [Proteiniclasticum sp.]